MRSHSYCTVDIAEQSGVRVFQLGRFASPLPRAANIVTVNFNSVLRLRPKRGLLFPACSGDKTARTFRAATGL